jgi:hypothetical protein
MDSPNLTGQASYFCDGTEIAMPKEIVFTIRPRGLVSALLVSPLVVLAAWWIFNWPWGNPNAPAWVQAVGSIAAILASVWIANAKDRRDEERALREVERAKEKMTFLQNSISHTALSMHDFAVRLLDCVQGLGVLTKTVDWGQVRRSLEGYYEQLNKLSALDLPSDELAKAYLSLWGAVREAHAEISISMSDSQHENLVPNAMSGCKRIIKAANYWSETTKLD